MILHEVVEDLLRGQIACHERPLQRVDDLVALVDQRLTHLRYLWLLDLAITIVNVLRAGYLEQKTALFVDLGQPAWGLRQTSLARLRGQSKAIIPAV